MTKVQKKRSLVLALVIFSALGAAGCAPGKGAVSGIVRFKGKPLPYGRITFFNKKGNEQACSSTIIDGAYTVLGIPTGPSSITVETFRPTPKSKIIIPGGVLAGMEKGMEKSMKIKADQLHDEQGKLIEGNAPSPQAPYVPLPLHYKDPAKTTLTYEVIKGPQTKDFDLVDEQLPEPKKAGENVKSN